MQTKIIQHEGFVELFDIRVTLGDPSDHGVCSVSVINEADGNVWATGDWNGQYLSMDDPDAIDMELYLDTEEAVAQLAAA
jgi:hypothetical protein